MSQVDLAVIAETLPGVELRPAGTDLDRLPPQWRPIAAEPDPQARRMAALALWNESFLVTLPQFAQALRTRFTDVRACLADGEPALVYLTADSNGGLRTWIGSDPAGFVEPHFWEHFPEPLRVFLREVHAGFTSCGRSGFGPLAPRHMETLAELAGDPDGVEDWDEVQEIASTRLLLVASNDGMVNYCLSPDLEKGDLAIVFQGDIDPTPYGAALDDLMLLRLER